MAEITIDRSLLRRTKRWISLTADLLNDYRQDPEDDWDGPRIERLWELLGWVAT